MAERVNATGFRLSIRFTDLTEQILRMTEHLEGNAGRLGVSDEQVAELNEFKTQWDNIYNRYRNPETHSPPAVAAAQTHYKKGEKLMRGIRQQIKNNRQITLTADDYKPLAIRPKKTTLTRAKPPQIAPVLQLKSTGNRKTVFRAVISTSQDIDHRRLPYGCKLLARASYEPEADRFDQIIISGRSTFIVEPPPDKKMGTTGYLKALYFNTRGDTGPESKTLEFVVI